MRQIGLFDTTEATEEESANALACTSDATNRRPGTTPASHHTVRFYPDFSSWLELAGECIESSRHPGSVWWSEDRTATRMTGKSSTTIHSDLMQEARAASCHSSEDRWALLYSILWRMQHDEPQLLELAGDPEVAMLRKYAKAVSRDVHKMKAFVRFRKVEGEPPRYVAWFEPEHYIVEYAAPFFKRRFANMHWSILTPAGCAHWECAGNLWFSEAVEKQVAPEGDQFEDAWRVYYKSIFNPARLKVTAMQSEMPKKYWKNLPEAQEIQSLIVAAESRTRTMINQRKDEDQMQCGARPAHPDELIKNRIRDTSLTPLQTLKLEASLCNECPQGNAATQTVFGEGPENARIMFIGEQPGDQEDLEGVPFTGPAGQVLSAALKRAGIDRDLCYLTNAVKHFGFEPRGKRRIHKRPEAGVVSACSHWLQSELQIVDPDIVVYLGATAASTYFGKQVRIQKDRGRLLQVDNRQHLITAHPSSILRLQRGPVQRSAYAAFVNDLTLCANYISEPTADSVTSAEVNP